MRGERAPHARAGQKIGDYRVEQIADSSISFTYLPLKMKQTLDLPNDEKTPTDSSVALVLFGCAGQEALKHGQEMIEAGNEEQGLARLEEAMKANPKDAEIRNYYLRHSAVAVQRYLQIGRQRARRRAASTRRRRRTSARSASTPTTTTPRPASTPWRASAPRGAGARSPRGDEARRHRGGAGESAASAEANPTQREARAIVRKVEEQKVKAEPMSPQLAAALKSTITIELRDAPVRTVFELISKRSRPQLRLRPRRAGRPRVTVFVRDTTIEEVIRFVLVTSQLERRVLNPNTVLIYPNTPAKTQAYRELTVKSFYLANADVKQTANMLRNLVKTRDLFVDEKLNLLVMRDTPEAVRMAEKLIANQDLGEAEVMLEVEVLEVGAQPAAPQAGIEWPGQVGRGRDRRGRRRRADHRHRGEEPQQRPVPPDRERPADRAQPAPAGRPHQRARQPAHPREEQGEGAHPHRRQGAGDHHDRRRHRLRRPSR